MDKEKLKKIVEDFDNSLHNEDASFLLVASSNGNTFASFNIKRDCPPLLTEYIAKTMSITDEMSIENKDLEILLKDFVKRIRVNSNIISLSIKVRHKEGTDSTVIVKGMDEGMYVGKFNSIPYK